MCICVSSIYIQYIGIYGIYSERFVINKNLANFTLSASFLILLLRLPF